jgi:hypothetical protein
MLNKYTELATIGVIANPRFSCTGKSAGKSA